jgi:hypothetical protein
MKLKHIPRDTSRYLRLLAKTVRVRRAPIKPGMPHTLPGKLVVSLTSYPPRFPTLDLTLRCLLNQDMAPDALVLWIAHNDMSALPKRVRDLQKHGLLIRECEDLRSFKKIIPALHAYPGAFIVIADDDIDYSPQWLRRFVEEYRSPSEVLCQRAQRVMPNGTGLSSFAEWAPVRTDTPCGVDVIPIGCGGVMYPPGSLPPRATDASEFMRLCPTGDDLWLYWMFTSSGLVARRIEPAHRKSWYGTQVAGLWQTTNTVREIDRQIAALVDAYGLPLRSQEVRPVT